MPTRFNIVRFAPNAPAGGGDAAPPIVVVFEGDFVWSAGLRPNINVAKSPYTEVAKLNGNFKQTGTLEFFFSSGPSDDGASPDVSIPGIMIVDAIPSLIGVPAGSEDSGSQVIEWAIHFADQRWGYTSPRGGRLRWGVVNPANIQPADPADVSGGNSPNGTFGNPLPIRELMGRCLSAMNVTNAAIDAVDDIDPPRNLQWHGNHAPTELEKLLNYCGAVFCPQFDGSVVITFPGTGDPPSPNGPVIGTFPLGDLDHRGEIVVFSSAPTAKISTLDIKGINSNTWEYVVQDIDKTWRTLGENPAILSGFDPVKLIQQNFAQLTKPGAPAASDGNNYAHQLKSQLYHCIRLNVAKYPPSLQPILHQRLESPSSPAGSPQTSAPAGAQIPTHPRVMAKIAVQPKTFDLPYNATTYQDCNAHLHANDAVLVCHARLGKMSGAPNSAGDFDALFAPLADGDLVARISQETLDAQLQPVYYEVGFQNDGQGGVIKLSDSDTLNAMDAPDVDTIFVARPDFQWLNVDGADVNKTDLDASAQALAPAYLADSSVQAQEIHVVGFAGDVHLSGVVSEIRFNQREVKTVICMNNWWRSTSIHLKTWRQKLAHGNGASGAGDDAADAYPQQPSQQTQRTQLGLSGSTQPNVPLATKTDEPPLEEFVGLIQSSAKDGSNFRWRYQVQQAVKSGLEWAGWTVATGAQSVTAYNFNEVKNGAAGTFGNGMQSSDFAGTLFQLVPLPNGTPVKCRRYIVQDGSGMVEWWFEDPSSASGGCGSDS
jgi:hypothetical protein